MNLNDYKLIFIAVGLISVLLIASPALSSIITPPAGEQFSELYLLGPEKMLENYPYNTAMGQNYTVYAGVKNNLGSLAYYILNLKIKNQTEPSPNQTATTPRPASTIYENRFALANNQSWIHPMTFSITNATFTTNQTTINTVTVNDRLFSINKPIAWNSNATAYNYQLVIELWLYNTQTDSVKYDNRYVQLQLNMTDNAVS